MGPSIKSRIKCGPWSPLETTPLTMPNLSQGRAPQTAVMLEPKNPEPGSGSEKGGSYGHVPRGRQKQKHNDRRSSGGGNPRDHLPLHRGPFVRNSLRRHIPPSFHRGASIGGPRHARPRGGGPRPPPNRTFCDGGGRGPPPR